MSGFSSSKFNPAGRILGKNFKKVDPVGGYLERKEKAFLDPDSPAPQDIPGSPTINEGLLTRQAQDIARRRRGAGSNVYAGNAGFGSVMSPVLGGS